MRTIRPDSATPLAIRRLCAVAAAAAVATYGLRAHAGGGAATDAYDGISDAAVDVHALADVYLQGNIEAPTTHQALIRAYDPRADEPALGALRLTVARRPGEHRLWGFRLDADVGDLADAYLRFDPAQAAYPGLSRALSYIEQAFVTFVVPVGRGMAIDAGKVGTPVGLEENEAQANWSYSRSLLFLLGEPSYHAGLRATYEASKTLALSAFWFNGWDANVLAGNGMRTFAGAASWTPTERLDVSAVYMAGPERAPTHLSSPALGFRNELDASGQYALNERVTVAATGDYGRDAAQGGVSWWGVGGYVRAAVVRGLGATVRAEHYADTDGFTSGTRQKLAEVTATLELRESSDP